MDLNTIQNTIQLHGAHNNSKYDTGAWTSRQFKLQYSCMELKIIERTIQLKGLRYNSNYNTVAWTLQVTQLEAIQEKLQ
jgi:hypothetical protein